MDTENRSPLRSRLYACRVLHTRLRPRRHRFSYRLPYLEADLDELGRLDRDLLLLSVNRANLFSLHEEDYLAFDPPAGEAHSSDPARPAMGTLKQRVRSCCASSGVELGETARITLVTLPRLLGHAFNPVSFFVCHDKEGELRCVIAEVTNTFRERKLYFLPRLQHSVGRPACGARLPKHFYVSPFSGLEVEFDFLVHETGERLAIRIDDYEGRDKLLHSSLSGRAERLCDARLLLSLFRFPALNLRVLLLIHWQAFLLWLKRIPHFRKADHPELQRDIRRPEPPMKLQSPA